MCFQPITSITDIVVALLFPNLTAIVHEKNDLIKIPATGFVQNNPLLRKIPRPATAKGNCISFPTTKWTNLSCCNVLQKKTYSHAKAETEPAVRGKARSIPSSGTTLMILLSTKIQRKPTCKSRGTEYRFLRSNVIDPTTCSNRHEDLGGQRLAACWILHYISKYSKWMLEKR